MVRKYKNYKKRSTKVSKAIVKYVNRAIDNVIEDKHIAFDLGSGAGSINNGWTEYNISNPAQGTGVSQRIGNKIRLKSIEIYGILANGASGSSVDDPYNSLRCIVGLYRGQTNTPLSSAGFALNTVIRSDFQNARGLLIKKYLDKYIPLNTSGTRGSGYACELKTFKYYKKFSKGILVEYNDNTNNYPSCSLVTSFIADSSLAPHPGFVAGYMVVTYQDA